MVLNDKCMVDENKIDEIVKGLYLGGVESCTEEVIRQYNIKVVLVIKPELECMIKGVEYYHVAIKDSEVCGKNLIKLFDSCADVIFRKSVGENKNVLVHCKQGHHRSAAIIVSYMMRCMQIPMLQCITHVKKIRPCAFRRDVCITKCLMDYEVYLKNKATTTTPCRPR